MNTNTFLQTVMNQSTTQNGALSYLTTNSVCVDQFGKAGSYRGRDIEDVFKEQEQLWNDNKEFAVKFPFYLRMITRKTKLPNNTFTENVQKGQGSRDEAFKRLIWIRKNHPDTFYKNLWLLPVIGSWKDLWTIMYMDKDIDETKCFEIIAQGCQSITQKDLVKKYLPRIRSNNKCSTDWAKYTNNLAKAFCKWAGWTCEEYRKFKSTGKAHEFQKHISNQQYDKLEWNKIPGKALLNITTGKFLTNHNLIDNYMNWIKEQPVAKFNGYPYELGAKLKLYKTPTTLDKVSNLTIDAQFENLIQTAKDGGNGIKGNVWCALDTSGSMSCRVSDSSNISAFDVCISLGIYFATLNQGAFHKNVIMFDDDSEIKQLNGTFSEMYKEIVNSKIAWGSTNFQSVIDEIVRVRKNYPNIPLEDYPTTLLVVSDMQFNIPSKERETNYEHMKNKLMEVFPSDFVENMKFIWWNVNGKHTTDMPATLDNGGCYFFSGFDGSVITFLLDGTNEIIDEENGNKKVPTMLDFINIALNQEVLNLLKL